MSLIQAPQKSSRTSSRRRNKSISYFGVVIHDMQRLASIASILGKHGFGQFFESLRSPKRQPLAPELFEELKHNPSRTASRMRAAIEELGVTYIKFGQILSTRADLLPKDFIEELSKLQDAAPVLPFEEIRQILDQNYGEHQKYFAEVESTPLGAASIAQVHRARALDGSELVLKIQRPKLRPRIRSDIDIMRFVAKAIDKYIAEAAYFDLPAMIDRFEESIVAELDFTHERQNIEYFEAHYGQWPELSFPSALPELSTEEVLVMREIKGQKITQALLSPEVGQKVAETLIRLAYEMIFKDGVFHADPHPGNILLTPEGKLALLDFGSIGSFSPRQREQLMHIILAAQARDSVQMAHTLVLLGQPFKRVRLQDLEEEISRLLQKHLRAKLSDIDMRELMQDFVQAGMAHAIRIPADFVLGMRAMASLVGLIQQLSPQLDIINTLSQYARRLILENLQQDKLMTQALQLGLGLNHFLRSAPTQFAQIRQDLNQDGLNIRLAPENLNPIRDSINSASTRLNLTLLLIALTFLSYLSPWLWLFQSFIVVASLWFFVLLYWHYREHSEKQKWRIQPYLMTRARRKRWF